MTKNLIGSIQRNQFQVEELLSADGTGTTYQVFDLQHNIPLAMTALHVDAEDDPAFLQRIGREAEALQNLNHPNIVPFYGVYQGEDSYFILKPYLPGNSIRQMIQARDGLPLPLMDSLTIIKSLSSALEYIHARGIIHGNIRPESLIIEGGGRVCLNDLDVMRHAGNAAAALGAAATTAYRSPEQVDGQIPQPASDIYAQGVIFYEMITGQSLFNVNDSRLSNAGKTSSERIGYAHLMMPTPDPLSLNPMLSPAISAVMVRTLAKSPQERFSSPWEFFTAACYALGINPVDVPDQLAVTNNPDEAMAAAALLPVVVGAPAAAPYDVPTAVPAGEGCLAALGKKPVLPILLVGTGILAVVFLIAALIIGNLLFRNRPQTSISTLFPSTATVLPGSDETQAQPTPSADSLDAEDTPVVQLDVVNTVTPAAGLPTAESMNFEQKMANANILVYEDIWGTYSLEKRVDQALINLGLTGDNVVNDHDALGNFLGNLKAGPESGGEWDLIVVGAESRSLVRGELWDAIGENIENSNTSMVAEVWYLDTIVNGRIRPLMDQCGIDYQKDWWRNPEQAGAQNTTNYTVYWLQPDHELFNSPNVVTNRQMIVPIPGFWWVEDVGDLLKVTGSGDAVILAGTQTKELSSYGTIAECMDGRIIFQTFSTHDYRSDETIALWENYIVYALKNHFKVDP